MISTGEYFGEMSSELEVDIWNTIQPDEKSAVKNQSQNDSVLDICQEFFPVAACILISRLALKIFAISYFEAFFVGSSAFFITNVVRKMCQDYTFFLECEKNVTTITEKWPYLHVAIGIVAVLFVKELPFLCIPLI